MRHENRTRRMTAAGALLGMILVLGGCGLYETAELKEDIIPAETIAERFSLNREWWKLYEDAKLDALVDMALERNIDLARSALTINKALYEANILGAELVPTFSADTSGQSTRDLDSGGSQRSFQSQFAISYELDLWQKLRNAASAQEWEYAATIEDRKATRLTLVSTVADTYFELRYLNEAIKATEASIVRYQQLFSLTQAQYLLGKVARVEPLQAEQSLLSARSNLASLQTEKSVAEQTLRDLLNMRPGEEPEIAAQGLLAAKNVEINLEVPIAALAERPDISAAEARLQSAFKSLQAANASWYPTVTVGAAVGASSERMSSYFDVPFLMGTVQVAFPFLDWNTLRWNIKISEADFETAKLNFIESVTTALNEVSAAYSSVLNARQFLESSLAKYEKDVQISEYYRNRYDVGAAEFKDYLEALNTEDDSLISTLNAKYSLLRYENLVYRAMGGRYM